MPFPPPPTQTRTKVRRLMVTLTQHDDVLANNGTQTAEYSIVIKDQDGRNMEVPGTYGDLVPHLTPGELQGAQTWLDGIMQRAITAFIP